MRVEAVAGFLEEWFGHEGRHIAMLRGELLHEAAEHHEPVCRFECWAIAQVHLDLTGGVFRVRLLDGNAHLVDLVADRAEDML